MCQQPDALAEIVLLVLVVKLDNTLIPSTKEETEQTISEPVSYTHLTLIHKIIKTAYAYYDFMDESVCLLTFQARHSHPSNHNTHMQFLSFLLENLLQPD